MRKQETVLVVDDDPKIVALIRIYLERNGFAVTEASDGKSALAAIALDDPALIVLDVMLPEVDGLSVLEALRRTSTKPVIMISARGSTDDRIEGLQLGADDYVVKPFSPAELVARVQRVLDRTRSGSRSSSLSDEPEPLELKDLMVDLDRHVVQRGGVAVSLTTAEFQLLSALMSARGRVLTRDQLIDALSGADGDVLERTIDAHIKRLRAKLADDPAKPRYVATVRGVGYRALMPS